VTHSNHHCVDGTHAGGGKKQMRVQPRQWSSLAVTIIPEIIFGSAHRIRQTTSGDNADLIVHHRRIAHIGKCSRHQSPRAVGQHPFGIFRRIREIAPRTVQASTPARHDQYDRDTGDNGKQQGASQQNTDG